MLDINLIDVCFFCVYCDILHSRRVYVGNLPHGVTDQEIREFFNATMIAAQDVNREPGDAVVGVYLNSQKRFVLCFFWFFLFLFFVFWFVIVAVCVVCFETQK